MDELEGGTTSFTDEELARLERYMKRRGRATASATAAPIQHAPAWSTSMGMCMPLTENLEMFLKKFRTWACLNRCDSALDSETAVNTSRTPRADVEKLHDYNLVENSLKVW